MTRSNPSKLFVEDPKIEWIALWNLRARIRQRVEELGVELEDVRSENMTHHRELYPSILNHP